MGPGGPQQGQVEPQKGPAGTAQRIEEEILRSAPPEMRSKIERMVIAGRKIIYDPQTNQMLLEQFQNLPAGSDADRLAQGAASIMSMIAEQSKGPFPADAAMPAAVIIMADVADFLGEAGMIEVTDDLIAEATQALAGYMLKKLGIGPEELAQAQGGQQSAPQQQTGAPTGGSTSVPPGRPSIMGGPR